MGVEPPAWCKRHVNTNCPDCSYRARTQSKNEVFEYQMLEQGVQYDKWGKHWNIQYAFL